MVWGLSWSDPQRQPQVEPPLPSQVRPCVSVLEHPEQAEESSGPTEQPSSGTPCPSALLWRKQAPAGFEEALGREFGQGFARHGLWVGWSGRPNTTSLAHWQTWAPSQGPSWVTGTWTSSMATGFHRGGIPREGGGSSVVFSGIGSELGWCHLWPRLQRAGELNFTSWQGSARAQCRRACGVGYTAVVICAHPRGTPQPNVHPVPRLWGSLEMDWLGGSDSESTTKKTLHCSFPITR